MRFSLTFILVVLYSSVLFAQTGHEIKIKVNGYDQDVMYMAYHFGSKQYINDTVYRQPDDTFIIKGEEPLAPGNYMLVFAPNNQFMNVLINPDAQHFSMEMDIANTLETVELKGNYGENRLFYDYLIYLDARRKEADQLSKMAESASDSESEATAESKQEALNARVLDYQMKLASENPTSLTAALINSSLPIDYPDFEGSEQEKQTKLWRYTQKHYFDKIDLSDERLLRTSILEQRIDYFVDRLQVQHPDTVSAAIDYVLEQLEPSKENFKYFVIHFLNKYAKSKIVGMDAVYVHIAENYYRTGKAPWTDTDQLKKILDNSKRLQPLLIGKVAPDLQLKNQDGSTVSLHGIESDYTVLYFWRFDCDNCKQSTPALKSFYSSFKDKGVKLVALCTKGNQEVQGCWDYVNEEQIGDWLHLVDPTYQSKFITKYDIRSTPQIYLLDANKKILSKRIGASQLEEVMNRILQSTGN